MLALESINPATIDTIKPPNLTNHPTIAIIPPQTAHPTATNANNNPQRQPVPLPDLHAAQHDQQLQILLPHQLHQA